MPAALFLARLSAEVRLVLRGAVDPARCLAMLNEHVMATGTDDLFVTFLLATLDTQTHRIEVASAGHIPPMIRRAGGGPLEWLGRKESGLPLAVQRRTAYQSAATIIGPGDIVVLCTDGIYEAMAPDSRCLGIPALERAILEAPPRASAIGESILRAVREHADGASQADDMTILCLGRPPLAN